MKKLCRFCSEPICNPRAYRMTYCSVTCADSSRRGQGVKGSYVKLNGVHEHRVVAASMLGRPLLPGEIVHHRDGNKKNNDPSNLEVMTQSEHAARHSTGRTHRWERCKFGHPFVESNVLVTSKGFRRCKLCTREYAAAYREMKKHE